MNITKFIQFALIWLIIIGAASANPWTKNGNKVFMNDSKAYISAEPHTISKESWVVFTLVSKQYTGDIDIAFGFNDSVARPAKAQVSTDGVNWYAFADQFSSLSWDYDGFDTWYYATHIPVTAGQVYYLRAWVIPNQFKSGKYGIALKPSIQTLQQAKNAGNLYYLDPWWNASWSYKINNALADGKRPYQLSLNISNSTGTNNATHVYLTCQAVNCSDIRFTLDNTTQLPYWVEKNATSTGNWGKVWVNVTANGTVNLYYANPSGTSASNGKSTFNVYSDGSDYANWTNTVTNVNNELHFAWTGSISTSTKTVNIPVPYIIESRFREETSSSTNIIFLAGNGAGTTFPTSRNIQNYREPGSTNWMNYPNTTPIYSSMALSTYYIFKEVQIGASNYNHYLYDDNNNLLGSLIGTSYSYGGQVDPVTSIQFASGQVAWSINTYVTWVRVRNYAASEPVWVNWSAGVGKLITSKFNNFTNNDTSTFMLSTNQHILFNITQGDNIIDNYMWYVNGVLQSDSDNDFVKYFNTAGTYTITVNATNTSYGFQDSVSWNVTLITQLITPVNGTTIYSPFPPASPEISFLWSGTGSGYYRFMVSDDIFFNHIVIDKYLYDETNTETLLSDINYFWKVRSYTAEGEPGDWSVTFQFSVVSNFSISNQTAVHGIVYELQSNKALPISGAKVRIYNNLTTWSSEQVTGSNGYYLFSNLTNYTTYYLQATRSDTYKDSMVYYVTTGARTASVQNILLERCYSENECFYTQAYVKFIVQSVAGTAYSGVTASVYEGSAIMSLMTGTTGTDGSVTFQLKKDQEYRITFIKALNGINEEITITPGSSTDFTILIWSLEENRDDSVYYNLSISDLNATHSNLTLTYIDSSGLTTLVNFWVKDGNKTMLYTASASSSPFNFSYAVPDIGITYIYGFNATRNGQVFEASKVITFPSISGRIIDLKLGDESWYSWIAISLLFFVGLIFSGKTNRNGYILIPGFGTILWFVGWLPVSWIILSTTWVIGVVAYLRSKEKEVVEY